MTKDLDLQWKFKLWAGKFAWDLKGKLSCPEIWILTEGEGIESRLPFKIVSTLKSQKERAPSESINDLAWPHLWRKYLTKTIQISGKDSCTGDSGGPLVSREYSDDPWYQVGIRTVPQGNNEKIIKKY